MAKYAVETTLFTSCYEKGDLSSETKILGTDYFKTKKEALAYITMKAGKVEKYSVSDIYYGIKFTGKSWVEENTGEKRDEYYQYKLKKI